MKKERARRRGAEELREEILDGATEVFLEEGFTGTSLDAVIARVGGSKRAIYSHFGGKKELFEAIVQRVSSHPLAAIAPGLVEGRDIEDALVDFGKRAVTALMTPSTLALYRLVVAEGARFPELARAFFENGPGRASHGLATALEAFARRGELDLKSARLAAEHFIGMLRDDLHLKVVLGVREPPSAAEINRTVREAVRIFLNGCRKGKR